MKPTETGIAVALAIAAIAVMFLYPGLLPIGAQPSEPANVIQPTTNTTTMTPENTNPNELQILDSVVGTGNAAKTGDTVAVSYIGALENGTVFDASSKHPETQNGFVFTLGEGKVIPGWEQGIVGMKVGGKRRLVIPAALAYGNRAVGGVIPANSTLIFEVELLSIKK
jgi:peptidylprolyl isomerase